MLIVSKCAPVTSAVRNAPRYPTWLPLGRISAITAGPSNCPIPLKDVRPSGAFQIVQIRFFASEVLSWVPGSPYGSRDHWLFEAERGNVQTLPALTSRTRRL